MTSLLATVIAVLGTLSGAALASWAQSRTARTVRLEQRADAHRAQALAAVATLAAALADHRRAMWVREHHRLSGAEHGVIHAARDASHVTRSAVTAPLATVTLLLPALGGVARDAAHAVYALRDAPSRAELDQRRAAALVASDRLVGHAADLIGAPRS